MISVRSILGAPILCVALALSGCGSEGEEQDTVADLVFKQAYSTIKTRRASKGPKPVVQVTPKQLKETKVAALQANPLNRGGSDFLRRIAQRKDDHPGTVSVWRASDGAQLFIRGGVLVGSRGIGTDILSSEATPTVLAVARARSGQGERRFIVSNGDHTSTELVLGCDIDNLGHENTQVVDRIYRTVHLRETCIGGAGGKVRITNHYWVQPNSGLVRRSKQWTGPISGYFELILLKN